MEKHELDELVQIIKDKKRGLQQLKNKKEDLNKQLKKIKKQILKQENLLEEIADLPSKC